MSESPGGRTITIELEAEPGAVLHAERLRDGRIALGTRRRGESGDWVAGELQLLDRSAYLALAAWMSGAVEAAWIDSVRARREEPLRTAEDLYGDASDAAERLALEMVREIPPALMVRALLLLANSIGPHARQQLVDRLNRTPDHSEDAQLRRRIADEQEAFAYAVAAAGLFDAIEQGIAGPAAENAASG